MKPRHRVTADEKNKIKHLYALEGKTPEDISNIMGIRIKCIRSVVYAKLSGGRYDERKARSERIRIIRDDIGNIIEIKKI